MNDQRGSVTRQSLQRAAAWLLIGLCGFVWGIGFARAVALELHSPFFFGVFGASASGVCGAAGSLLAARQRHRQSIALRDAAPWMPLLLPAVDILGGAFQPWRGPVLLIGGLALTACGALRRGISRRVGFASAVLLPLAVYLPDLSPYVGRADTFEFQVVAPRLGIAHPSGYPLYILIGKLFSLLPFSSLAGRVNLSAAVCAALASGVLFLALSESANQQIGKSANRRITNDELRMTHASRLMPLLAALTLAFSPTLWSRAIEAEVYALNALLTATGVWIAVRWRMGKLQPARALPLFGLLTGAAIASHVTLGALAFLALPLLFTQPRPGWRALLHAALLGLAGLALYAYIPLRWPAVNHGETMTLTHFLRFVTNADSGGALRPLAFIHDPSRWLLVFRLLRTQVGWVGLALAALGLIRLFWKNWSLAVGTALAFSAWVWFNLSFYVADPDYSAFLIPGHVILIFWVGMANQRIGESANQQIGESAPYKVPVTDYGLRFTFYVLHFTFYAAMTLLLLSRLWLTGPTLDTIAVGREDEAWARYVMRQPLAEGAAILADSEKFPPLYYLQHVERLRPDLELVTLFDEGQYRESLERHLAAGQRVYLARYLPGLDAYGVSAAGPLVEVRPPARAALNPTPAALFGEALELNGFSVEPDPEGRVMHHLTLIWRARADINDDLEVRARLRFAGQAVWESAATRPVNGYTTTQAWKQGTVVTDYLALNWPQWIAPGDYNLELAVFPRFGQTGLPVNGTATTWYPLGTVTIPAGDSPTLPQRKNARFDGFWLTGADFPGEARAGGTFTLDLAWQRNREAPQATPDIRWLRAGNVVQTGELRSAGPAAEAATWTVGQAHTLRYTLTAPPEPGQYRLEIGWRTTEGQTMLPAHCDWLAAQRAACPLGEINVRPSNEGLANFADQIVLLEATLDANAAPAGGQIHVNLRWRGLRTLERDYTVFVQAIGPDGQVYGQVDSWPVQGARPTSGWATGEELADPYQFYLKPNAPSGRYQVIAGWYLLADMSRLPIINAEGATTGDFYAVGTFEMP
ncbi:MAG TPA: DUF2723 domain-containing protein [Anaerolineae bacterium]|nr:DUF2723 domain-containing protein [Anaerolineae bacterium]HQI85816.1 DUF2723 domain-containing protein [Anaerolineae bacterium]